MALSAVAFGWVLSTSIFNAWDWTGEVGTLIVLVAYVLATIGAARMLPRTDVPTWQIIIPIVTVAVLGYTIFRNVIPYPSGDGFWLPIAAGVWVAIALAAVVFVSAWSPRSARNWPGSRACRSRGAPSRRLSTANGCGPPTLAPACAGGLSQGRPDAR